MRFPTLCLSRNFLILGLCLLRRSSSSKKGRQHGLFVYRVGGRNGREFSGLFAFIFIVSATRSRRLFVLRAFLGRCRLRCLQLLPPLLLLLLLCVAKFIFISFNAAHYAHSPRRRHRLVSSCLSTEAMRCRWQLQYL